MYLSTCSAMVGCGFFHAGTKRHGGHGTVHTITNELKSHNKFFGYFKDPDVAAVGFQVRPYSVQCRLNALDQGSRLV
jgi:hypothetical protein